MIVCRRLLTRVNLACLDPRNPCCVGMPKKRLVILMWALGGRVVGLITLTLLPIVSMWRLRVVLGVCEVSLSCVIEVTSGSVLLWKFTSVIVLRLLSAVTPSAVRCVSVSGSLLGGTLLLLLWILTCPRLLPLISILTCEVFVLSVPLISLCIIDVGCLMILLVVTRPMRRLGSGWTGMVGLCVVGC